MPVAAHLTAWIFSLGVEGGQPQGPLILIPQISRTTSGNDGKRWVAVFCKTAHVLGALAPRRSSLRRPNQSPTLEHADSIACSAVVSRPSSGPFSASAGSFSARELAAAASL